MTRVSIVTITRNDIAGLRRTVESVSEQTWLDVEHIIVDAASTDGTVEYLRSLEHPVWTSEPDNGRYDGMNKGAKRSRGDLIWFLHSSDVFGSTDAVARVARAYEAERFEWGFGLSRIVGSEGLIGIGGRLPFEHSRFLLGGRVIPHQAAVFDLGFFRDLGGYDESFGLTADQLFMMKASMHSLPRTWTEFLCDFDSSGAGSTRGAADHYRDMRRARRVLKVRVTKSALADDLLGHLLAVATRVQRGLRRVLRAQTPKTVTL